VPISRPTGIETTHIFDDERTHAETPIRLSLPKLVPTMAQSPWPTESAMLPLVPTLVIGVGGTGELILRALRRRAAELEGPHWDHALKMLLIDTDPRTIARATRPDATVRGLSSEETICASLSSPADYREKSDRLLTWLSRRWLYNIPKSLRTDGLRPLGRLALIDHARRVVQRIRIAINQLIDQQRLDNGQRDFARGTVRVILVGSISGGTASGMLIDLAYAVRTLFDRLGIDQSSVAAVVTHSTGSDAQRNELARVNSFAWLTEYEHLRAPTHAYPGDVGAGFPPHDAHVPPLDRLHVVDLGQALDDDDWKLAANTVGDYLAAVTLWNIDQHDGPQPALPATLAISEVPISDLQTEQTLSSLALRYLRSTWIGNAENDLTCPVQSDESTATTGSVVAGAAPWVAANRLDSVGLTLQVQRTLAEFFAGASPLELLRGKIAATGISRGDLTFANGRELVDAIFQSDIEKDSETCSGLLARLDQLAAALDCELSKWILAKSNDIDTRLPGCEQALQWMRKHFVATARQLVNQQQNAADRLRHFDNATSGDVAEQLVAYLRIQSEQLVAKLAQRVVDRLNEGLTRVDDHIAQLRTAMVASFAAVDSGESVDTSAGSESIIAARRIAQRADERLAAMLQTIQLPTWLVCEPDHSALSRMIASAIEIEVRHHLVQQLNHNDVVDRLTHDFPLPKLHEQGGTVRRLALLPQGVSLDTIVDRPQAEQAAKLECDSLKQALLVTEIVGMSPRHTAATLANHRRDYAEYATRAHSRSDIAWQSLLESIDNRDGASRPSEVAELLAQASA
jgi:AcrR family transcriptional regulator